MGKVRRVAKDVPPGTPVRYKGKRAKVAKAPFYSPKSRGTVVGVYVAGKVKIVPIEEVEPDPP